MARRPSRKNNLEALMARLPRFMVGRSGVHLLSLGLVLMSLWLLASFVSQIITSAQMDRSIVAEQVRLDQLQAEQQQLATALANAQSDAYVEQVAREQFGLAREGDTVLMPVMPDATAPPPQPTPTALPTPQPPSNWRSWAEALFPPQNR